MFKFPIYSIDFSSSELSAFSEFKEEYIQTMHERNVRFMVKIHVVISHEQYQFFRQYKHRLQFTKIFSNYNEFLKAKNEVENDDAFLQNNHLVLLDTDQFVFNQKEILETFHEEYVLQFDLKNNDNLFDQANEAFLDEQLQVLNPIIENYQKNLTLVLNLQNGENNFYSYKNLTNIIKYCGQLKQYICEQNPVLNPERINVLIKGDIDIKTMKQLMSVKNVDGIIGHYHHDLIHDLLTFFD